jgi:hypothetical protein
LDIYDSNYFRLLFIRQIYSQQSKISDGQVFENNGSPLNEEKGVGKNENTSAHDIIVLGENLGINIEPKDGNTFIVKELAYNEQMKAQLEPFKQRAESKTKEEKPWWKVW